MRKIMEGEMAKIRNYPKWTFHSFYYLTEEHELKKVKNKLKDAQVKTDIRPVQRDKKIIGWNLFVR